MDPSMLYGVALLAVPVLLSLTVHEWAHARTALAFGDDTALRAGRVSLNPLVHLDLLGTLMLLFGPFGWAKPVPVDPTRLRGRRRKPAPVHEAGPAGLSAAEEPVPGPVARFFQSSRWADICVSLAGVGTNLLLALSAAGGLAILGYLGVQVDPDAQSDPTRLGVAAFLLSLLVLFNISMFFFNILPLYPLDGHHVVGDLLPGRWQGRYRHLQATGGRMALLAMLWLPWLARRTGQSTFSPLGFYLRKVLWPSVEMLLPGKAAVLFWSALERYGPYLPWW